LKGHLSEKIGAGVPANIVDGIELAGYPRDCRSYQRIEISYNEYKAYVDTRTENAAINGQHDAGEREGSRENV
jgi:hypothetical protein